MLLRLVPFNYAAFPAHDVCEAMDRANVETEYNMCSKSLPKGTSFLAFASLPTPGSDVKGQGFAVGECDCPYVHDRRSITNCFVHKGFQ